MLDKHDKIDMHIHSTASDGTWDSENILHEIKINRIKLFSLTDHDSYENIEKVKKLMNEEDIYFIPGVEVSSQYKGELFHILAYGTNNSNEKFNEILSKNRSQLEEKDDNSIKYLIKKGYNIQYKDYMEYKHNPQRGGWKALNFLIDKRICKDVSDYFSRLFAGNVDMKSPEFEDSINVIKAIKKAGGIPILAHPYYLNIDCTVEERLGRLYELGIEGVECYHPNHSKERTEQCISWCKKNNIIITAGSDCHGDFIPKRKIGMLNISVEKANLKNLLQYV
jgi:predicted metal-dependent phosphoesterase TrpH